MALGMLPALAGHAQAAREPRHTWHSRAFGTRVSITIASTEAALAERAASAALAEIAAVDAATQLHTPTSALARLNRHGRLEGSDRHLTMLLRLARQWSACSDGAFDVTVQPLWLRHFAATVRGIEMSAAQIESTRALIDWRGIRMEPEGLLSFDREGMQVTLNGLVQGYASDRAWAVLREHGIENALVDAGECRANGLAAPLTPWRIGVRTAQPVSSELADVVALHDAALASSGNDGFSFSEDRRLHHILDPRTGVSPGELAGVTVLASDACSADALSTTCMVLGVERSRELLVSVPGAAALFQYRDGRVIGTRGWPHALG